VEFPYPLPVYAAMLGGTMGGQLLGMALDAVAFGRRIIWVPLACSLVLEALAGERFAAASLGRAPEPRERIRLSVRYSLGLAALSLVLAGWLAMSHTVASDTEMPASSNQLVFQGSVLVFGLLVYTAFRTWLMRLFARRTA
jgi:hypothetical protein